MNETKDKAMFGLKRKMRKGFHKLPFIIKD